MASVNDAPSHHRPLSRPQISSRVTLARSLFPSTLSDLSLKTSNTRQSGGVKERWLAKNNPPSFPLPKTNPPPKKMAVWRIPPRLPNRSSSVMVPDSCTVGCPNEPLMEQQ